MALASPRRLLEIDKELWYRRCRDDLTAFAVEVISSRGTRPARHHRKICEELARAVSGSTDRLLILAPPGSAKTTYVSHVFASWLMARRDVKLIAVSHTQALAESNSRAVQRIFRDHGAALGTGMVDESVAHWYCANGAQYRGVGVGTAAAGARADYIIVDDPIRSRQEAESETGRESLWEYYNVDLLSRLTPSGKIIMIATPFHENDLMCRLLREQPEQWRVLRMPAIAEENDQLGRAEGEPLWSDDPTYGYGNKLIELRDAAVLHGRQRDWYAMYQGRPRPPEGAMFRPKEMPIFEAVPPVIESVRAWDFASSTRAGADYTVGIRLARTLDDLFIVTDLRRFRGPPEEVRRLVKDVAQSDGYAVKIWLPKDPAQAGADQADSYIRMLSGYPVDAERMSGDKATRADGAASQANIGRLGMVRAAWNSAFIEELAAFPRGVHDDQVDALSLAFAKLEQNDTLSQWMRL